MMMGQATIEDSLLGNNDLVIPRKRKTWIRALCFSFTFVVIILVSVIAYGDLDVWVLTRDSSSNKWTKTNDDRIVQSEKGVVAADEGRCSEIGASILRQGGHAVDAAVATTVCLGVVNPMSSGIGGGAFMTVRSPSTSKTESYDMRETAPLTASQDMYESNLEAKYFGALSMAVPGEIAGLHKAWLNYGRLAWRTLFQPAITLARDGFVVAPYLDLLLSSEKNLILKDPGLSQVFAPNGKLLRAGDICYNAKLAQSLEAIAEQGPQALYDGIIGEELVKDVQAAGGILTMEDLKNYKVDVTDAMSTNVVGYTVYGMHPPSSGTVGLALVLNILDSFGEADAAKGSLGVHRLIEALKHMFSIRMNLGDPNFVNIDEYVFKMLSPSFAKSIREKIFDNTTFPSDYYLYKWSQLRDHGTSHFSIVDADRNAVSMTTSINFAFGAGVLSPSTGIVLNNQMGDFSVPTEIAPDNLPPAPSNFIRPNKRPLSSMAPLIITKDNQLVGVIGSSGGMRIIPGVLQVFINHFLLGMEPLAAVQNPRIYHRLIPNVVQYENFTSLAGDHIVLSKETRFFLKETSHELEVASGAATVQFVLQTIDNPEGFRSKIRKYLKSNIIHGTLTAVSDPRKDGKPAAV